MRGRYDIAMSNNPLSRILVCTFLLAELLIGCSPAGGFLVTDSVPNTVEQPGVSISRRSTAFAVNAGQIDSRVLFHALGSATPLFFARQEVVFPLPSPGRAAKLSGDLLVQGESVRDTPSDSAILHLRFEGANPEARVVGEDQLTGIVNYFIGNDPSKWRTNVPTYGSITYEGLYPGIDLVYDGREGILKGTYIVAPGADTGDIRWRYDGASSVDIANGELLISVTETREAATVAHRLVERKPVAWQTVAGNRTLVSVHYVIHGDGDIGFESGEYDATRPLIIDPTLDYSTYLGGSGEDSSWGIAVDSGNNIIVTGSTDSLDFPSSDSGSVAGDSDIFVTKLDPSQTGANQLIYTTYIGGQAEDHAYGIDVDSNGNAYVTGYSDSNDFPTTANAYQNASGGYRDAVVAQLDATGAVNYSSYLGGAEFDEARQVVIGGNTTMYVVGYTSSTNFPTTGDAFQTNQAGEVDAFVAVVDPSEFGPLSLVYSTYYGGASYDEGWAIDVSDGIIYFAGNTDSDPIPLANAIQQDYRGIGSLGFGDAYIAKLDPSQPGSDQLLFATYLGGGGSEVCAGLAADASGLVYAVGFTESVDFPITNVSPPYGGGFLDTFVAKIRTNSSSLTYSRFFGGSGMDGSRAVVIDPSGGVYVAGGTGSEGFPMVNPIQADFRGGVAPQPRFNQLGPGDAFVAGFGAGGELTFSTYLGGTGAEAATGIALDLSENVYVTGGTTSTDLDMVNPFQGANSGYFDAFVVRITQQTLTVNVDGGGSGTVTSDLAGIKCGADCTEHYPLGTVVTLTAHPGVQSYMVGWGGDCSGTELATQVIMDADRTCIATFGYPVGGVVVPVDKLDLLLPWLGLAALVSLAALTVALARRRRA